MIDLLPKDIIKKEVGIMIFCLKFHFGGEEKNYWQDVIIGLQVQCLNVCSFYYNFYDPICVVCANLKVHKIRLVRDLPLT